MAPKKAAVEAVTIDKEKLTSVTDQLESQEKAQVTEALQVLLRGTEESVELRYEMVEKNVAGLVLQMVDNEDSEIQLLAVRVLARYATYQGKLRKVTCGSSVVARLWAFLQQYEIESEVKEEYERKEAAAGGGEGAAPVEAVTPKDVKKEKGGKDKKGGKSKGKEAAVVDTGPQFNIPSAELLEAVLRGLNTMAMVDTKVINRITSLSSMGSLTSVMRHPHPLIKERSWKLVSTMCRNSAASVAMYDAGVMDVILPDLEVLEISTRLKAVELLTRMASVRDSRLERMEDAGVPQTLYRYMSGLEPVNAPVREEVRESSKGGKGKAGKAHAEEVPPEQSPEMHALQAACARLLSIIGESVPSAVEYAVSYNGLDVLAALLPVPVQKQLEKYGLPLLPGAEDERGHLSEAAGDEEGEEEEEEEQGLEVPSTPPDEVLKGMLATKAEREAGERAKAEAEERAKAEEQQKREEEAAARADWEANVKGLPKAKPESSAVQAAVLNVLRVALQNDELRAKMQQAPWPQMFLHFVHAADPEAVPIAQVEEPKASKKGAAGAKGGKEAIAKGKSSKDGLKSGKTGKTLDAMSLEPNEEEQEWHDPTGPLYPPFDMSVRAGAIECTSELLSDWEGASAEAKHFAAGQEMLWIGRAVDQLRTKTELLDPLDVTLATRLALALGDVGSVTPEAELLKSDYIRLVRNFAVLAHQAKSRHLREAVGRASLALPGDEHFTAIAEPPPPSPAATPLPDPLVTSKYMWDAYGKPVNVDGFVLQPTPLEGV